MPLPLLQTKLYIPSRLTSDNQLHLVLRPRLMAKLVDSLDRKLTLLPASAGFGKSTLIAEWHSRLSGNPP